MFSFSGISSDGIVFFGVFFPPFLWIYFIIVIIFLIRSLTFQHRISSLHPWPPPNRLLMTSDLHERLSSRLVGNFWGICSVTQSWYFFIFLYWYDIKDCCRLGRQGWRPYFNSDWQMSDYLQYLFIFLWRIRLSCISVLWLPHRSDHASLRRQQLFCRILSKWTVQLPPIVTIQVSNARFLAKSASPWMMRIIVAEAVLLVILWRNLSRYLRQMVWDTTHSSLRCRMCRKLSFNSDYPLCSTFIHLQLLVTASSPFPECEEWRCHDGFFLFSPTFPVMFGCYNFLFLVQFCLISVTFCSLAWVVHACILMLLLGLYQRTSKCAYSSPLADLYMSCPLVMRWRYAVLIHFCIFVYLSSIFPCLPIWQAPGICMVTNSSWFFLALQHLRQFSWVLLTPALVSYIYSLPHTEVMRLMVSPIETFSPASGSIYSHSPGLPFDRMPEFRSHRVPPL